MIQMSGYSIVDEDGNECDVIDIEHYNDLYEEYESLLEKYDEIKEDITDIWRKIWTSTSHLSQTNIY